MLTSALLKWCSRNAAESGLMAAFFIFSGMFFVPLLLIPIVLAIDLCILPFQLIAALPDLHGSPQSRQRKQATRQAIRQAEADYKRDMKIARSHRDPEEREAYAAGAQQRHRDRLAQLGQQ